MYPDATVTFVRTNVVLDKELVERAMAETGLRTRRELIDYALRRLVSPYEPEDMLDLRGMGWDGDFEALRGHPLGE